MITHGSAQQRQGTAPERIIHTITPGDHFSPLTGSAIPTVVHGLASAAERVGDPRHAVVVDRSTYPVRYDSADVLEYQGARGPSRGARRFDVARGRVGLRRRAGESYFAPLVGRIGAEHPALVLAHNAPLVPRMLESTGHRVALYMHNQLFRTYSRTEIARSLGAATAVICVSESLAAETRTLLPVSQRERVHVVPNAVDTELFRPRAGPRGVGPMRVLFIGRVIPDKGPDVLLRAVAEFAHDELEVVVVGSQGFDPGAELSSYERALRALAQQVRVGVEFSPFTPRSALADLLRSADVLVVPSRWAEPSGLTVGEGLATGIPVIASRVGGIPDVLGHAGLLVPPDDPEALARALRTVLESSDERGRLGAAARSHAELHDWAWAWRNLRDLLQHL